MLCVPAGAPVLVGGPPTVSMMALGMKAAMAGLGKAFKKLKKTKAFKKAAKKLKKAKQKAFKNMKPGFVKCKVLKAEPVNVVTGEVIVEQFDFELPWRIPLKWIRRYSSASDYTGCCGKGWETPADARLVTDADGIVAFHDGSAGAAIFPGLPAAEPVMEISGGATLHDELDAWVVHTSNGKTYRFVKHEELDGCLRVRTLSDRHGNWIEFVRNGSSLVSIRDGSGPLIEVTSEAGRIRRMVLRHPGEPARALLAYDYLQDRLAVAWDALGQPYRFEYMAGRLVRHTDRNGLSFYYEYGGSADAMRCVRAWGDGRLYDYAFDYQERVTRATDARGNAWLTEHDGALPTREVDPVGAVTSYEYDDAGRTSAMIDPLGRRTAWEYDSAGNLVALTRADGSSVVAGYNAERQPVSLTDPDGNVMEFAYDRGRLISRKAPGGGEWTYRYDSTGCLVEARDPGGASTRLERDDYGRVVVAVSDPGARARFVRDSLGHIVERIAADGSRSSYAYDEKGRLLRAVFAHGIHVLCQYDPSDNLISYTDEQGRTTRLKYSGLGEVAEVVRADGSRVRYGYDEEERLVSTVNERGETFQFERDAVGRVVRETDYWGGSRGYEYDMAGDLVAITNPLGERIQMERDSIGRVLRRTLPDGAADVYTYDLRGNIVKAENANARVERSFDGDGNLTRESINGIVVESKYDVASRRVRRSSSLGHDLDIAYDDVGRIAGIAVDRQILSAMQYGPSGRLEQERLGPHLERKYHYDHSGRLERQTLSRDGTSVSDQHFKYDVVGQLIGRSDGNSDEETFEYDPLGRIRHFTSYVTGTEDLDYDPSGNLLKPTNASLLEGEVRAMAWQDTSHFYDAAGRLVRKQVGTAETRFTWNAVDQLVACTTPSGEKVTYEYDPLGRRTRKVGLSNTTRFSWDGDWLLAEHNGSEHPREFVFRPFTFEPLAAVNGSISYFETDMAGVPHGMFDAAGTQTWHGHYDALGGMVTATLQLDASPFRLQGQYYDTESGLAYTRHRYYDAAVGSFVSQDPVRLAAGTNPYRYGPNVWNWVDIFGLECKTVTVYRVEGPGNTRVHVDANGGVTIPDKNRMLHVSFNEPGHAQYFLNKTHARGHTDNVIKSFEVPEDVVKDIQSKAVKQSDAKKFPGAPQIDDPNVSKELGMAEKDVLGVRGADLEALEQNAIPGSGKVH